MRSIVLATLLAAGLPSLAGAVVVIGFERVNAVYPSTSYASILGFYSGGTSSQGTSGVNLGATFDAAAVAVCLNGTGGSCSNASRGGLSLTSSEGALGIGSGTSTFFDYPSGFSLAIGFSYAVAPGSAASISAYSGLGGTGTLLSAPLVLLPGAAGCAVYNAVLCPLGPGGYSFPGTAKSVVFTGQPGKVVWDDLTLGANDPQPPPPVPEPSTWMTLAAGLAVLSAIKARVANDGLLPPTH